jgi:hypothetical protein
MDDLTEWWEDFWETQSQKKELKSNIKADLESKVAFLKLICNTVMPCTLYLKNIEEF